MPSIQERNDHLGRRYICGKEEWPSVTTYIQAHWGKKSLDDWRKRVGEVEAAHISKVSSDRGQALHNGIEDYLNNKGIPNYSDPFDRALFYKIKPHLDKIDNICLLEKPLMSVKLQVAGRPDCIADYEGIRSVIDFKTSTKVKRSRYIMTYFLQCGFYGYMAKELYSTFGEFSHGVKEAVIVMATEDNPTAQIFKFDMDMCRAMVTNFVADPVKFQTKFEKMLKAK